MKKLLEVLVIVIVVLGIGFGFLAVNPQWGLSQKILPLFMTNTPVVETGALETTGIDLTNCVSYFDGCNNCSVKDGKADACTLMYCETPSEPKCLEYATGSMATEDKFEEITFPKLDYITTVKTVDKYPLKDTISFDLLCGADQTTCNNNPNVSKILSIMSSAAGSSNFETDFLFTNTKYQGKSGTGSYQYSIYIIPNIFGYKTLQEAKNIRGSLGRIQDPYVVLQVTPKYILFDRGCYRQEERQQEEGTIIEGCKEIEKNIIQKIQLN